MSPDSWLTCPLSKLLPKPFLTSLVDLPLLSNFLKKKNAAVPTKLAAQKVITYQGSTMLFVKDNLGEREQPILNSSFSRIIYFFFGHVFTTVDDSFHEDCRVAGLDFLFLTLRVN